MRTALLLFLALAPLGVAAALIGTSSVVTGITASPLYPTPGESVTLTANTLSAGDTLTLSWVLNGATLGSGVGLKSLSTKAGPAGSRTNIVVTATDASGAIRGSASYTVRPADVDLVWEGAAYVPAFYVGRPLATAESSVTVLAVPRLIENGTPLSAATLVYEWAVDGKKVESGYGKSILKTTPPLVNRPFVVSLTVRTVDGLYGASGSTTIAPVRPFVFVYEDVPLTGIDTNRALPAVATLTGDEVTYRAFPLFVESLAALSYQWKLNGAPLLSDPSDPRAATFRRTGAATGAFEVGFSFTNADSAFESGSRTFTVSLE